MRFKIFSFFSALAIVISFSLSASAQYMTQDVIFLKAGYIPNYTVTFDEGKDGEMKGFAGQGEYNLNFSGFWMGFGLEYQYVTRDTNDSTEKKSHHQFILPMVSFKLAAVGGLYVGAGVAGKYLIATEELTSSGTEAKKKIDLWANGIIGYHFPVGEGVFLDLEGRFGWNLTNKQFSKYETSAGGTVDVDTKSAYDIAFYVGVGFRAMGSN